MLVFQAVYQKLYEIFDQVFIFDSYSSRTGKGTHAGFNRLIQFSKRVSSNYSERAYILKCDFRKFFDSIDQQILINLIEEEITDKRLMSLITTIIKSFEKSPGKGIPLGNVTSQLFANIYLNKFDQFVKHTLKAKYYVRYCDDFIILDDSSDKLIDSLQKIKKFCTDNLKLELHPNKLEIRKIHSGIDFLGYVSLPHYRVLRTKTKNRLLKRVNRKNVDSYLGVLKHCRGQKIQKQVHGQLR
jgi:retron-type reverse transcriptase